MRKSASLLSVLMTAGAVVLMAATAVQAGTFVPEDSTVSLSLGGINAGGPPALPGTEAQVTLSDNGTGGHDIAVNSSVWSTINYGAGTSLYTGVPIITNIKVTVHNATPGTFTSNFTHIAPIGGDWLVGPHLGGLMPLQGQLVLWALGTPALAFTLQHIGAPPGGFQHHTVFGISFSVTNSPWVTSGVPVTGITTNVVSYNGDVGAAIAMRLTPSQHPKVFSTGGGFVTTNGGLPLEFHTVTLYGKNELVSASQSGAVTLVSPMRINTSPSVSGRVPGAAWLDLVFVPEPGLLLLLASGAVGLVAVGRRQRSK